MASDTKTTLSEISSDLSFDSDEGEPEKPAEVEVAPTEEDIPAGPIYTEEEMHQLIKKVKDFTTLFDLHEQDWNENVYSVITQYFEDSKEEVLTIFFDEEDLLAMLGFPTIPVQDLTYFLKQPTDHITPENFHEIINFGTVGDNVEGAVLNVLENVYAPMFFNVTSWPDSVKSDFCAQMHGFLAKLTDLHYKMLGLTVIYVPQEGINLSVDEASKDKELVKRLEGIVVHWTRQIRVALGDQDQTTPAELLFPTDEYQFWIYRYQNLAGLSFQLKNVNLKHITDILKCTQSTYIRQFLILAEEIEEGMKEAVSNIEYLQILNEPCETLALVENPSEIPLHIPKILHLVRVIWVNSPYYNSQEKLSSLCRAISNQIITQCTDSVDLTSIFQGNTRAGIKMFEACIECCTKYKMLYEKISEAHNSYSETKWALDNASIFNHVDSFIQRCKDMIEVCEAMITFGRTDETEMIALARFGGTRGEEFEMVIVTFEKNFETYLKSIVNVQHTILDVQASSWYDDILRFRTQMKDIEVIIENLVIAVFDTVQNVDEGIETLQSFYHYSKRETLRPLFDQKTAQVYKIFSEDIQDTKKDLVDEKDQYPASMPHFSGRALMARLKKKRLMRLMKMLDDAEWMPDCGMREEVRTQYEKLMVTIEDGVKDLYRKWVDTLNTDIPAKMDRSLMCRSTTHIGLLECNFDRTVLSICEEAKYWEILKFDIPSHIVLLYQNWDQIKFVYESVLTVVMDYNKIILSLSNEERSLFRELIKVCDKKIQPGLGRLQWNTDVSDVFISDCCHHTSELQEFVDDFKNSNLETVRICEKICDSLLIKIPSGQLFNTEDLQKHLDNQIDDTMLTLVKFFQEIMKLLIVVYEGFEEHLEAMETNWHQYIHKMDRLLEEALRLCVKSSLQVMLDVLHGDATTGPMPLIKINVDLRNNKINFDPSLQDMSILIQGIMPNLLTAVAVLPRLQEKFHLPQKKRSFAQVIENDDDCRKLHHLIKEEMHITMKMMSQYLKRWEPFRQMWEVDKAMFIAHYEQLNNSVATVDADIGRYTEVANDVQNQETTSLVHFTIITASQLKDAIIQHCVEWQNRLTDLVARVTSKNIDGLELYIKTSSKKVMKEPLTLQQLQDALKYHQALIREINEKEKLFPIIIDQFGILKKYEVHIPEEMPVRHAELIQHWEKYLEVLTTAEEMLHVSKEKFRAGLLDETEGLKRNAATLLENFLSNAPFTSEWKTKAALSHLEKIRAQYDELRKKEAQLQADLAIFHISFASSSDLQKIDIDLTALELVWQLTDEWDRAWESYKSGKFWVIQTKEMEATAETLFRKLTRLSRELKEKNWEIVDHSRARVDAFRRVLPLISDLKNPAMRSRHWDRVKVLMDREFDQNSTDFTLEAIMAMKMQDFADDISEVSKAATMELQIEMGLKQISETWAVLQIDMVPHRDKIAYRLKSVDDIFQTLEENQGQLSSMKSTRFVEPFLKEVDFWERSLSTVMEVLELVLVVQRHWLYLENIFLGEDIRKQLPKETNDFDRLTAEWRIITYRLNQTRNALKATRYPNLYARLSKLKNILEAIQRALEKYLETKKHIFPRFYFISDDDLLEILAQSKKPENVQPHLKKCFDNLYRMKIAKNAVNQKPEGVGMFSADGECVEFGQPVVLEGAVEVWLSLLEDVMRLTLKDQLRLCKGALRKNLNKRDKWIKEWPGQLCITSSQIQWTTDCTRSLLLCKQTESKRPMKKLRKKQNQILSKYSEAIRGNLTKIQRLKVVAIVTIEIHARDVIDKMYKSNCSDVSAFEWLAQLRFYLDRQTLDCTVRQTNTSFVYGHEYLGNSGRLVITPLTDRCYITLTTALHLHRGGSPKGPAGTGKTETVKDLGKGLGSYVIVVNCSEGLDFKSMGRMFSGLAQTGAWGCFDEFNRINIEVLSVVAQQILSILSALAAHASKFVFSGVEIKLVHSCGIFITMNPGYAGRTELPDNLKSMFRPISMIVPDSAMIAEIILFGEGFHETRVLAKKVFTLYSLAMQQLSKQDHYDFGLRGMVALLRYAGRKRRSFPDLPDDEVVLLAMKDMNIAKLTTDDLPLFNGITSDLFPGVETPIIEYDDLTSAVEAELTGDGLQFIPVALTKVIQLYETKGSRHSVMIVGQTGSGKSVTWRTLQKSLTRLQREGKAGYNAVKDYPINPKALTLAELYGEFNLATNEWLDGVLSAVMRETCADELPDEKWIVFDGPVDAVWIENMNSVMDDNKVLTLINSERITMPDQVSLLFEVGDLAVASPATVSRCGMVYNDYKGLGWRPYVNSWLQRHPDKDFAEEVRKYFDRWVNMILDVKRLQCEELVRVPELCSVMGLCKLLECFATRQGGIDSSDQETFQTLVKLWFLFCMVWSLCASVDEDGRKKMDTFIREKEGVYPLKDTVYEYYVDMKSRTMMLWEEKLSDKWKFNKELPFFKIIVPTVDTVRYQYLVSKLLLNKFPGLLVGPVGTGKTSMAATVLDCLDPLKYSVLVINMSAQTSSKNVQDTIESRVEKRTKGVYVPAGGKTMVTFLDDLNMPAKEVYGAQPPLELIREWIDYAFWYDRRQQTKLFVKDMLLMAAMGPPGGGRTQISNRLLSRFNVINMTFPSESQITRIYGTMLEQQVVDFDEEVKRICAEVTAMTVDLYHNVVAHMLPTPSKTHYLFNLRDISKIFQGLLRSTKDHQNSKAAMLRLWIHESFRVFYDRLIDEKDQDWFVSQLGEQLGAHFELTFHNLCPEKASPVFGDFVNPWHVYEDLTDHLAVRKFLEGQLDEYNLSPGKLEMDLVLFKDAIEHICRIIRVISQPRGNMLLVGIGGSGRRSMARISAYICEYGIFQIEVTKHYRVQEFREDLKVLYRTTGVDYKATTFLFNDIQISDESFLEIFNNMLSSGEVTNLFKPEEFDEVKNALADDAVKNHIGSTNEAMFNYLIERVRTNLHIVLCMSPIGEKFRNRIRQYPALVNCTTIDWFHEWPKQALLEVANKSLATVDFLEKITGPSEDVRERPNSMIEKQDSLLGSVAEIFATIHNSVSLCSKKMMMEMKRHNYVTPTNYLELVAGYKRMLEEKRVSTAASANKLRNGLFKIDDTREKVQLMSVELEEAKAQVAEFQHKCDECLVTIVAQKREADDQQKSVAARSVRILEEEAACKKLADIAQADLNEAMPALEEAMRALDALNKKDLTEIKSYGRPPAKVEMVMEAVMILKQVEPSWAEAKRQLGDQNFLNNLREFDKDNISDRTLKKINVYTSNEEFEPEKVGIVSLAAKSLCMWVLAIEKYGRIYRIVAPKKAKLEEAQSTLQQKQASLAEARAKLEELSLMLEKLKQQYDESQNRKEELRIKADELMQKLERAAQLVDGLAGEKIRWEQTVKYLDKQFGFLPGDCLMATGFVSYMGPFVTQYREELLALWNQCVIEQEVPYSPDFLVTTFLADQTTIREWNIQGLPSDNFSTENGIIVTRGSRWPLLIDPQCQGMKWIKNMEGRKGLKVIDFGQPDFMKTLESAVQFGNSVLLQNVVEVLDPSLAPILNKDVVKQGGQLLIKFNDKMIQYNQDFRFFITTKLGNPHYAPEISTKTTLVNFAVKEQGLEAQLLGIVVRKERPQLEEQKDTLVLKIASGKRQLIDLEDELLRLLNETKGSLLDDLQLLITLQQSKTTSISVTEQLQVAETTEVEIDTAREGYRPCAQRASVLFFVLNDMGNIDPMYQFSLDSYIALFTVSIDKSPKSAVLDDRIDLLNEYHTYSVYRNTCRGLFECHKLLFSFHMCMKILEGQGKVSIPEYNFLLKGGVVLDREEQMDNPCTAWLTDVSWDNITELDKLAGFHGVVSSFEQYPRDWHTWYTNKKPEELPLIGEWEDICTEFQKMLFVRSLRLDRISFCVTQFIVNTLGPRFVEPPVLDVRQVVEDSTSRTPLIFVLSPGVDPTSSLLQLAESSNMSSNFQSLSLGQGQAPIATRLISSGVKEGNWVFLANCHLSLSWMPSLDKIVETLQQSRVNPRFRLWLSSSPHPDFPISILQAGIKMTTEPPKGIKANLKRLYQLITEAQFSKCQSQTKYRKLLFALCFFHSILLERKKFQQLGWNVIYSFNDSDFEVSENLLGIYLDTYPDTPWDALKYLIAGVNYGGHITDDWDRRLVTTYINQYFHEDALNSLLYRLSSLPTYYIPRDGSLQSYRDYIVILPNVDQPEAFGQHSNADITSLRSETRMLFETLMSLQLQAPTGEGESMEDKVTQLSADVLSKIPSPIDYENTEKLIGAEKSPLQVVLLQEIARYNLLLIEIRDSLEELQKGIKGLVVMSSDLEDIFNCIFEGRVPAQWLKMYPSMKLLGSWTRDLVMRVEHFSQWASTMRPPLLFWLSAYTFPTGFLTAVLQTSARLANISIDSLSWDFTVFTQDEHAVLEKPKDGVFVRGMFLEGAGWDKKRNWLIEPLPMELVCQMPLIHFKPMEHLKKKTRGMYVCPCYYYPVRSGSQGRASFVVAVDLKSGTENSDHWTKRGTALLLSLPD